MELAIPQQNRPGRRLRIAGRGESVARDLGDVAHEAAVVVTSLMRLR